MFEKKTVLILGAGASLDFGYPTGKELVENIAKEANIFGNKNQKPNLISELSKDLEQFKPFSIDLFLSLYPKYQDIGKRFIVQEMLKCEDKEKLFKENNKILKCEDEDKNKKNDNFLRWNCCCNKSRDEDKDKNKEDDNWYRFLIDAIITGCKDAKDIFEKNKNLTIITFNYDISLEYYIYRVLKGIESFNEKPEDINAIDNFFKNLDIIHIYGQLGCYNWHSKRYNEYYGDSYTEGKLVNVASRHPSKYGGLAGTFEAESYIKCIEVIGSEKWKKNEKPKHIKEAIKKLKEAKKVFILGFGFYKENMDLLEFSEVFDDSKRVFYINYKNQKKIEYRLDDCLKKYHRPETSIELKENEDRYCDTIRKKYFFMSEKGIYEALNEDFDLI